MSKNQIMKYSDEQRYKIYSLCLTRIFDRIDTYLSKKNIFYQEIKDFLKTYKSQLEKDKSNIDLNSDKYFPIMAKALELENYKIAESILSNIRILVENNFLTGKSPDVPILIPTSNKKENKNRKLIDTIIETLIRLDIIKEEEIWSSIIDVLNELIINENINIHNESFEKIFKFYVRIFQNSRNQNKVNMAKVKFELLLTITFDKMCQIINSNYQNKNNFYSRSSTYNIFKANNELCSNEDKSIILNLETDTSNSDVILTYCNINQTYNNLYSIYNTTSNKGTNTISNNNGQNTICTTNCNTNSNSNENCNNNNLDYHPIDIMVCRITKNIINTICINDSKTPNQNLSESNIPKNDSDFLNPKYRKLNPVKIENDQKIKSGNFGWCFICNKTANYYCKEAKVPICSYTCKALLEKEDDTLEKIRQGIIIPKDTLAILLFKDCLNLFKYLCSLLSKDNNAKVKILALDMIAIIIEKYGEILINNKKDFIKVLQDNLTEGLFQNCLCENIEIFSKSIHLFFLMWETCRDNLKLQIGIFNETVFLKILDSENYSFAQKRIVLEHFSKQENIYFIELYVNYDCDLNEKFLVKSIITALNKIAQGKYCRTIQAFTEEENAILRNLALSTVFSLTDSIFKICNNCYAKSKNNFAFDSVNNVSLSKNNTINSSVMSEDINTLDESLPLITENEINDTLLKDKIDSNLKRKNELLNAADKFNISIKRGISYLKRIGYINTSSKEREAVDIANFLRHTSGLKKNFIGELLGENNNELDLLILKNYCESFNYKDMHIIPAMRMFLSTFQLPGEGQKIDRILQNFAAKYHKDNQKLFENADIVYYLTFSIMILQTELHNPNIKNKMDFTSFSKLLEGQNGGKNLDQKYLKDIYEQILNNPFSLPELEEQNDKLLEKKEVKLIREKQRILSECNQQMKQNKEKIYAKITDTEEFLTPFMENIWTPILAMYTVILEESNDRNFYYKCIGGISSCIKILGLLNLDLPKTSFINSFANMSNLIYIKPIGNKNILCIKELLFLANSDCRYIKSTWNIIFNLINKIYYYHLYVTGSKSEKEAIMASIHQRIKQNNALADQFEIEKENMSIIAREISSNDYEKIFAKTVKFDKDSIVDFIESLCKISKKQFKEKNITRVFWLQKIVEVAELNLHHTRFIWSKIWKIISDFLIEVGISSNTVDSITAVDSLRQLAMKYLQKTESKEYHFQSEFFAPFQLIWEKTNDIQIKDYIISCINNLVLSESESIKSGWQIILNIYSTMVDIKGINDDFLLKVVNTLLEISLKHFDDIKGIFLEFSRCVKIYSKLFPHKIIEILDSFIYKINTSEDFQELISCYFPLISSNDDEVRQLSVTKFFICLTHGLTHKFSANLIVSLDFWNNLFNNILFPTIKNLASNIYSGTLEELLIKTTTLFNDYFNANNQYLPSFFVYITNVISSENENIADTGIVSLKYIYGCERMQNSKFLHCFIMLVINSINKIVPSKIINIQISDIDNNQNNFENSNRIITKFIVECMCLHSLLEIIDQIIDQYFNKISEEDNQLILKCLKNIFIFSYNFNSKVELRIKISEKHIHDSEKMLGIYKQMKNAIKLYYKLLTKIYFSINMNDKNNKEYHFNNLMDTSILIFNWVIDKVNELSEANEKAIYDPITEEKESLQAHISETLLESVFPSIMKTKFYENEKYKNKIVKILLELILCNLIEIRQKVKEILDFILFSENNN